MRPRFNRFAGVAAGMAALATASTLGAEPPPDPRAELDARIAAGENDDRRATWLIDRAALELSLLSHDDTDTSLLFGIPSAEQRARGERSARTALALLDRASAHAEEDVRRLEEGIMGAGAAAPGAADRATAAEDALARLVDVEQSQRLPYFKAVAHALIASSTDGPERAAAARAAIEALGPLGAPDASTAGRRVVLLAVLLNTPAAADAGARARRIEQLAAELAAAPPAPGSRAERWRTLAERLINPESAAPPSTLDEAEADARVLLIAARADAARRNRFTARACEHLLSRLDAGSSVDQRLRIYAKLAALIEPGTDTGALPPEAALARAVTLLRSGADSLEARAILGQLVQRPGVDARVRAEALWESAAVQLRSAEAADAMRAFDALDRFSTEFPDDPRTHDAARTVAELAQRLAADAAPEQRAQIEQAERRALDRLLTRRSAAAIDAPDRADAWRSRWVVLGARSLAPATLTPQQLAPLAARAAEIALPRPSAAAIALTDLLRRAVDEAGWEARPPADRLALIEAVRRLPGLPADDLMTLEASEAKTSLGRGDGVDDLRGLLGGPLDDPARPTHARIRLSLAAAMAKSATGRAEALGLLRQLTAPIDDSPTTTVRPPHYWRAWALILELSHADNTDGSQSEGIRGQVRRLEILDPALGGPETAERIRRIRAAIPAD